MNILQLIFWAAILVIMSLIEASTVSLVAIWFVAGALVAFIAALFTDILWIQILLFVITAICLLVFTRPIVKKYLNSKTVPTNLDMNLGKVGIVKTTIEPDSVGGRVTVDGVDWLAISDDNSLIEEGTKVIIKEIKGAKLIVSKENQED